MPASSLMVRPSEIPPLRAHPFESDTLDEKRAEYVIGLWRSQDQLFRARDRQVEENLRVLSGQHWIIWSELRSRYVDISQFMTDEERRWRQLPVLNRVFLWYMITHARLTENPPVLSFQAGPDRIDAELAEIMDAIWKWLWSETEMISVLDEAISWLIPSGEVGLKTCIDPMAGESETYEGEAVLRLLGPNGQPMTGPDGAPIERYAERVPYDEGGTPLAELVPDPEMEGEYAYQPTGDPYTQPGGMPRVDVIPCFDYRGEWGVREWHRKKWHIHRSLMSPEQFYDRYGYEEEPDTDGQDWLDVGSLFHMVFGSGTWGGASGRAGGLQTSEMTGRFITTYELWQAPSRLPGTQLTRESAGGRLLTVTGKKNVVRDGVRPAAFKWTSPIRRLGFVNIPGRPSYSSPQEMLNGAVRTRNRIDAQVLEHVTRVANPTRLLDKDSGLTEGQVPNLPGVEVACSFSRMAHGDPIRYVSPPNLQDSVWRTRQTLTDEFDTLGNIPGSQGSPPTSDASGELVKELRFNADRFVGPTARGMVTEMGRLALDFQAILPLVMTREKLIRIPGDDNIARTVLLLPEVLRMGHVNVEPELESMLPEGRGERQNRIHRMWQEGAFGEPLSFQARTAYLELARFPHIGRATRPGGADRSTAEQNVGKLLQGAGALEIPILPMYDHEIHLWVLERFMKSPEYLKVDPEVQQQCMIYWQMLLQAQQAAAQMMAARQAAAAVSSEMAAQGAAAGVVAAASTPQPAGALPAAPGPAEPPSPARRSA